MNRKEIVTVIEEEKLVAIVRLQTQQEVPLTLQRLISSGIKVVEVTSNTPGYLEEIGKARKLYPHILIGAGTVINTKIASEAIKAGAQFLVTPNTNIDIIAIAHEHNIPVLVGALTPTEICLAVEKGADLVKLFPAGNLGIDYFKAIKGPLSHVKFFVVGGIDLQNISDWMAAGASGVGLGSVLTKSVNDNNQNTIEDTVQKFLKIIKKQ